MSKATMKTRNVKQTIKDVVSPKKIKIFIMTKIGSTMKIIYTAKGKSNSRTFSKKGFRYIINTKNAVLDRDNTPILFYSLNKANPLSFGDKPSIKRSMTLPDGTKIEGDMDVDPKILDVILNTKKIGDRLGSRTESLTLMIMLALICGVIGILAYSVYHQTLLQDQIDALIKLIRGGIIVS